jgi:hypothetical protein
MPLLGLLLSLLLAQEPPQPTGQGDDAGELLARSLAEEGVILDLEHGLASIPVSVLVTRDLLEFLLVGAGGAAHESLLATDVRPSVLATALLALGVEPGRNAEWLPRETGAPDEPSGKQAENALFDIHPPVGDGFLLYLAWREGGETYFFRVEDLLANLDTGRSMRRHRWVYLGSRFARLEREGPEVFVADVEGNLINIAFFYQGNTLLTAALPAAVDQTIWVANAWLLPARGSRAELVFARRPLERLPGGWEERLPDVAATAGDEAGRGR